MDDDERLADRFEANRPRLRAVAYRMLGSLSDAEDALQEAWLRASAADASVVANLEGWLTTILARVCLDMLRSRKSRREEPLDPGNLDAAAADSPEQEAVLADSVGLALLVVLDTLPPAERVAFVLHDTFGLPFDQIAAITGRSGGAAPRESVPPCALITTFIAPCRYSKTSRERCRASGLKPIVSSTWPSACGRLVAYSMNSMPSMPSGFGTSPIASRSRADSLIAAPWRRSGARSGAACARRRARGR